MPDVNTRAHSGMVVFECESSKKWNETFKRVVLLKKKKKEKSYKCACNNLAGSIHYVLAFHPVWIQHATIWGSSLCMPSTFCVFVFRPSDISLVFFCSSWVVSLRAIPRHREISVGPTYFQGSQYCHFRSQPIFIHALCWNLLHGFLAMQHIWQCILERIPFVVVWNSKNVQTIQELQSLNDTYKHNS